MVGFIFTKQKIGLICGSYLAKEGEKVFKIFLTFQVLILEKRPMVGGAAITEESNFKNYLKKLFLVLNSPELLICVVY
jgi:hypothetical protein